MKWKIIIAVALISAAAAALKIQSIKIESVTAERDLVQQNLESHSDKIQVLMQELSNQTLIVQQQKQRLKAVIAAHNSAVKRNRQLEYQHEQSIQALQKLKRQDSEFETWVNRPIPDAADDWLRHLGTGADGDNKTENDQSASAAPRADKTDPGSAAAG